MSDCIIVVDHAEKRFGEQVALRDVSVSFEAGKIHGIIGRNGSGKRFQIQHKQQPDMPRQFQSS